ncbi:hypothetical protein, partial [uncultured Muribaculum sp.]|uniref:hypothetical protein n=1 Tax=uncultured Muribaculum sp. TaxID=1918613 RepID=UPI0025A556A2
TLTSKQIKETHILPHIDSSIVKYLLLRDTFFRFRKDKTFILNGKNILTIVTVKKCQAKYL